jgi:hypothetical protein
LEGVTKEQYESGTIMQKGAMISSDQIYILMQGHIIYAERTYTAPCVLFKNITNRKSKNPIQQIKL